MATSLFATTPDKRISDAIILESKFEMLVDSAEYYSSVNRWKDAERMTINALKLRPANKANWLLWANLAEIRRNLNDPTGSLEAYDIGLSLQPHSLSLLSGRAELFLSIGEKGKAMEDLDSILGMDPESEWPRIMRGWLRLDSSQISEAEEDFTYMITHYPSNPEGYNGLAIIRANERKVEEAIELYEESLKLQPQDNIYFKQIALLIEINKISEASEKLREAMKKFPRSGNLFLLRAYIHRMNFQNEEAEIAIKLAKEYDADPDLIKQLTLKH